MPIEVDVEGFGVIEFPDGTSQDTILDAIKTKVPEVKREQFAKEKEQLQADRRITDALERDLGFLERTLEPLSPSGLLNQPARAQRAITGEEFADPFQPGQPAIAAIPEPKGTGVGAGLGRLGARLVNMAQTPESLVSIPAIPASAGVRALFAGDIVRHLPDQVAQSAQTLGDIESTPAERTLAIGEPLVGAGIAGLLTRTPRTPGMLETSPSTSAEAARMFRESMAETDLSRLGPIQFGSRATELPPAPPARPKSKPAVPETPAEVGREINVLEEIRGAGARTIGDIQKLFPRSQLNREAARRLRDQAWTKEELSKAADEGETPPPAEPTPVPPVEPAPTPAAPVAEAPRPTTPEVVAAAAPEPVRPAEPAPPAPAAEPVVAAAATPDQSATSIKNAKVDAERQARGLPAAMEPSRRSFGEVWTQAMRKIEGDPTYPDRLISELADRPRAITDLEDASLLHRQVDLQNEYYKAASELTEARDAGNSTAAVEANARLADISDRLLTLYNVNKAAGTETGRGLSARRMMANEDFTLSKMELDRRVSKGGQKLTPDERAEVVRLNKRIEETKRAYDEYVARTEKRIADAEALNNPRIKPLVERILGAIEKEAEAARTRLKERGLVFGSGPLHELPNIRDYAIIGASKIARGAYDFGKWSGEMVKEFGDRIKPHLAAIFDESGKYIDEQATATSPAEAPQVKTALAGKPAAAVKPTKQAEKLDFEQTKAKQEWAKVLFEQEQKNRTNLQKSIGVAGEVVNLSRAILTSLDLSAVLRQGGFIGAAHPIRAAKSVPAMFKAFASEAGQHAINQEIARRPNFPLYQRSKLYLAEHGQALSRMEEAYMSRWVDKMPTVLGGGLVRGSQRAYTTFLNKLRADSFDAMAKSLSKNGTLTPEQASAISNFINVATGRGLANQVGPAMTGLSTVFFAPRYVASRFQLLAGQPLYKGTAGTRKLIAGEYARYLVGIGTIYGLAKLALGDEATIENDPRSSDFGKIRIGNTRIDLLSGLQQATVASARFGTGERKTLKGGNVVQQDRAKTVGEFLRSKLAPVPGALWTTTELAAGQKPPLPYPQTFPELGMNLTVPMVWGDIYDAMKEHGIEEGTALALLALFGAGVQTFGGTNQSFEKDVLNAIGVQSTNQPQAEP